MTLQEFVANLFEAGTIKKWSGSTGHHCGMPAGWVAQCSTSRKVVDGDHAVFIYPAKIVLAYVRFPSNYSDWYPAETCTYNTTQELVVLLGQLTAAPQAKCWSSQTQVTVLPLEFSEDDLKLIARHLKDYAEDPDPKRTDPAVATIEEALSWAELCIENGMENMKDMLS